MAGIMSTEQLNKQSVWNSKTISSNISSRCPCTFTEVGVGSGQTVTLTRFNAVVYILGLNIFQTENFSFRERKKRRVRESLAHCATTDPHI